MAPHRIQSRDIPLEASAGKGESRPCQPRETAQSHCLAHGGSLYPWLWELSCWIQCNFGGAKGLEKGRDVWRGGEHTKYKLQARRCSIEFESEGERREGMMGREEEDRGKSKETKSR
jgi:hypothetical protein